MFMPHNTQIEYEGALYTLGLATIMLRILERNIVKFGMMMYPDRLLIWLSCVYALLNFLILPQILLPSQCRVGATDIASIHLFICPSINLIQNKLDYANTLEIFFKLDRNIDLGEISDELDFTSH